MKRRTIYTLAALALAGTVGAYAAESADGGPGMAMHGPGMGEHHMGGPGRGGPGGGEPGMDGAGMFGGGLLGRIGDELGLTVDQRIQVFSILAKARPQMEAIHAELRKNREALATTDPGDPKYASVVAAAARSAGDAASRMVTEGSNVRTALWNVLTPDQRTKAKALRTKFMERMHERGEGRGRWGHEGHDGHEREGGEHRHGDGPPPAG